MMEKTQIENLTGQVIRSLFVELEASGRHVHVTAGQAQILFGHSLTPKRPLCQQWQYRDYDRFTAVGPKGRG